MKKTFALLLTCIMLMGMSITVCAEPSPSADPVKPDEPKQEEVTSPQTGESQVFAYSMMTACLCAGVMTVSFRKMK